MHRPKRCRARRSALPVRTQYLPPRTVAERICQRNCEVSTARVSSNGLTYVTSARVDVGGSLEIKQLRIKLASLSARVTM